MQQLLKFITKQISIKRICFHLFVRDNTWSGSYRACFSWTSPPISCADGPDGADIYKKKQINRAGPAGVEFWNAADCVGPRPIL